MNIAEIERLIRLVAETDLDEVEVKHGGSHVRIARHSPHAPAGSSVQVLPMAAPQQGMGWGGPQAQPAAAAPAPALAAPAPDEDEGLHVITATMVGTFYRRPNPEAAPFVKEGDSVKKGQVVCLLEAMKILNEIESDVSGAIVRIYPDDGQPVEFGEKLFAIRAT